MIDGTPRVQIHTTPDGRFGLVCLSGNPDDGTDDGKRLTFSPEGKTNNTRVMVDGDCAPIRRFTGRDGGAVAQRSGRLDDDGLGIPRRAGAQIGSTRTG